MNSIDYLVDELIKNGSMTLEQFETEVERKRQEIEANPSSPQGRINGLDMRTYGMQEIDSFTLEQTSTLDEKTAGMQDIDDFTLSLLLMLQGEVEELKQRIITLEGGN